MIIYIHGFASSGQASKAQAFRDYFKSNNRNFIAPSLPYQPDLAIKTLEELIASYQEDIYLIGSSLGGYYSLYLSQLKQVKKVVLINPTVNAAQDLQEAIGETTNYYDNSHFSWQQSHVDALKNHPLDNLNLETILLLSQKGDEVIDYQEAVDKLKGCPMIIEENGNHSFKNIQSKFQKINDFFV